MILIVEVTNFDSSVVVHEPELAINRALYGCLCSLGNQQSVECLSWASRGWSGDAMVLGKLPVPGRPTSLITVGQWPIALAVGAGGGGLDIFTLIYPFSSFSLSL